MGRFLLFFSYIGTHYRGMQIQRQAGEVITRFKTVQGVLEEKLRKLYPTNEVIVKTSSRTDCNVHALCNTVHVDLVHKCHPREFNPQWITATLNRYLKKSNERVRILNTVRVPDYFRGRQGAKRRSYVYHLAVVKKVSIFSDPFSKGLPWLAQDAEYTFQVYVPFDMEQFLKAAEILSGMHCFLSFTTKNFLESGRTADPNAELDIRVQRSTAWMHEHRDDVSDLIDFWEVHFHGRSFLYKQVRRMMAAMVAVARGRMTLEQLQRHLDNPSLDNPGQIQTLPGNGLTLTKVHYPDYVFNKWYEESPEELLEDSTDPKFPEVLPQTVPPRTSAWELADDLQQQEHRSAMQGTLSADQRSRLQETVPPEQETRLQEVERRSGLQEMEQRSELQAVEQRSRLKETEQRSKLQETVPPEQGTELGETVLSEQGSRSQETEPAEHPSHDTADPEWRLKQQ